MAFTRRVVLFEHGVATQTPHLRSPAQSEYNRNSSSNLLFDFVSVPGIESSPTAYSVPASALKLGRGRNSAAPTTIEREFFDGQRANIAQHIERRRNACARSTPLFAGHLIVGKRR